MSNEIESIDTPEYVTLKEALIETAIKSSASGNQSDVEAHLAADDALAAHIDAKLAQACAAGKEDAGLRADEATRLRRVVNLLGLQAQVPGSDDSLRDCLFSALGLIARKIEEHQRAAVGSWDVVPKSWNDLYVAVNQMMARLGGVGEIDARSKESLSVMTALKAIDGGTVSKRALELHEKVHMPLFQATALALREVGTPSVGRAAGGSVEGMVSVCKDDANNYCCILSLLGMEEEGDPVAEIERLMAGSGSVEGIDLDKLEALAKAATPQNLDSAQDSSQPSGYIECPECGGEGSVDLTADYCNYDGKAMGVQFYGIGPEHRAAEAFFRAANPATVLKLIAAIRAAGGARDGQPEEKKSGAVYGIIDPDYGRIYTMVRKLAWEEGYAIGLHGSFTRDLDLIAVPWADGCRCKPEKLVARIVQATGLKEAHGNPGEKPHGRKVWTLLLPDFGDPRFVDLSIMPVLTAAPSATAEDAKATKGEK